MSRLRYAWKPLVGIVLAGLLLIAAVVGALAWQQGQFTSAEGWVSTHTTAPLRLSLNTATIEDLLQLPQMTKSLANDIVAFREVGGTYFSTEDLRQIHGVTDELYEQWKPYISV